MNDPLLDKLDSLHAANQPDPAFADSLDARLRTAHASRSTSHREIRYGIRIDRILATAAALILIASVLVLTVPPLRALAQEVLDYFIVGTMSPPPTGTPMRNTTSVVIETVEEAEAIAGFDALEVIDSRLILDEILAGEGYVNLLYKAEADGQLLLLSQWASNLGTAHAPVASEIDIQEVRVNGNPAQFVTGAWTTQEDSEEWVWERDIVRFLHWQTDGVSYTLGAYHTIADTAEALVAIAEALE